MQSDKTISRGVLDDLSAFAAAAARTRSFSRAAAELNLSNSMLSYTIKRLENRLGYPLLRRTSRSVAPTAEGQMLLLTLEPALGAIDGALGDLSRIRDRISGTLRITAIWGCHSSCADLLLHGISGRNRRSHHRLRIQGSCFRRFRRWHPAGREARTGYGGGAGRAGSQDGRGRLAGIFVSTSGSQYAG